MSREGDPRPGCLAKMRHEGLRRILPSCPTSYASELASAAFRCYLSPASLLEALMRGPISEAVIIVILGFLIGGTATAVIHFMTDSKWPPAAAPYAAIGSHATHQR